MNIQTHISNKVVGKLLSYPTIFYLAWLSARVTDVQL